MDFHLATPDGDVYLFSYEDGRVVVLAAPQAVVDPAQPAPEQ